MKSFNIQSLIIASLFVFSSTGVMAQTFDEGSDASALLASAKVVPLGTTKITGDLTNTVTNEDVDVYQFSVSSSGLFTIEAKAIIEDVPDMNLIVFNSAGQGLAGDDDNGDNCDVITSLNGYDSCLTLDLTAGTYYFAVGDNNIGAFESIVDYQAGSGDFIDNDSGILDTPTTEIAVIVGNESGPSPDEDEGDYEINFSVAVDGPPVDAVDTTPVPTLSQWSMIILSMLIGLMVFTNRKRLF